MRFSIIVPVLNEEAILESYLASLVKQCAQLDYELLVVDGGSSDGTVDIAGHYGHVITSARGRATQMNAGAALAGGDVFLFLPADTQLPAQAFSSIEEAFRSPTVVAGAFRVCFNCERWAYRCVAYFTNMRSRLRGTFTGDQAYFVRASSFRAIGGYPEQPLMEDLEIIKRLRARGRVVLLPLYVTTSARRHERVGLLRSVFFMWYLRTLYAFGVAPTWLQKRYPDVR